jgi:Arc/MetJ family transcription regulator
MLKHNVVINCFSADAVTTRTIQSVSATKARQLVQRAVRRGVKRFGGKIVNGNWGSTGGQFPKEYISATVYSSWGNV